jgi:tRNA(adenine34) deaminase
MLQNDQEFMGYALELAKHAEKNGEVPVGAIITLNDEIIAEGWNQPISSCDPTAHAEIIAMRAAAKHLGNYRLLNTTLYVTLEPCAMCVGAMVHARVKRLVFGAYDSRVGAVTSVLQIPATKELNHRLAWEGGVMADECSELLSKFFQVRRNKGVKS